MSDSSALLTVPEVAKILRISEAGVYRLVQLGAIPSLRIGALHRFRADVIERIAREGTGPKVQS